MKKRTFFLILLSSNIFTMNLLAKEPVNLAVRKLEMIRYYDSGEYKKDQQAVIDRGLIYLKTQLKISPHKKRAIVLDVDETVLSNYPDMVKMNFGGELSRILSAADAGHDPAIESTLNLYRFAHHNHVAIFFVTGRREHERHITEKNLSTVGYGDWNQLLLRPEKDKNSLSAWKTAMRTQIEKAGYDIVLNIGDQQSDLVGGHADLALKLPNPYYVIP